ncbi:MAG TPA: HepT-like ribonuclease domain-containing protein [Thermoanaerobaculia bacterium]|nr:HepT-like ribonuclease domain-containing protein [Thermoanaerobaculia bacterium]
MTFLVERLAELRRHLEHLRRLSARVPGPEALERDQSLHNDVMFSLLMVAQLVVDIAGELSARRGWRFEDYTEAVRNLRRLDLLPDEAVAVLESLPGFRNVVIHEYVSLDLRRVVEALARLEPVEQFLEAVRQLEAKGGSGEGDAR